MSVNQSWWEKIRQVLGASTAQAAGDDYLKAPSQRGQSAGAQTPASRPTGSLAPSSASGVFKTANTPAAPPANVRPGATPDQMYSASQAQQQQPSRAKDWHDPYSLYYAPDMIVDSKTGQIYDPSGHGKETIAFRGYGAYAKAHGFNPPDYQLGWPEPSMGGGGAGGGSGAPFVYNQPPPSAPSLDRAQPQSFNMQDPYPAPQRGAEPTYQQPAAPPPTFQRDSEKYRKLLGY